jgi:Protein of unknown function (DUF2510)
VEPPTSSGAGWYADPWGRFEYRYFNGVQWTSDVAIDGQRYVSPIDQVVGQPQTPARPRGKAITAMVTGISAVALGWVPFVFVFAAGAAIVAAVFGILGLKTAKQHDGYGRGFALVGLALSPIGLAVCVGGFFFTKAVVREFRDFVEPGPHELFVEQPCTLDDGQATFNGTIRNLDDHDHDYRIFVEFSGPDDDESSTVSIHDVAAGETAPWSSSVNFNDSSVECEVTDVFGPIPFDIDEQS